MSVPSSSVTSPGIGRFALKLLVALAIGFAMFVLYELRILVLLTFLSIIVAVFWSMVTDAAMRIMPKWMPRSVTLMLVVLVTLALVALLIIYLLDPITKQFDSFASQFPDILRDVWMRLQPTLRRVPGLEDFNPASIDVGSVATGVFQSSLGLVGNMLYAVGAFVTTLFLAIFLAMEPERYVRGVVGLFPPGRQEDVHKLMADLGKTLRQWMQGVAFSMLTVGVLVTVLLWIFDIEYFLLFGIVAGLLDIVPYLGPVIAFIGPTLIALSQSTSKAIWVIASYTFVQGVEGNIIVPYFMSREVSLPPVHTLFAIFAMGQLFGLIGILLAPPTLAVLMVLVRFAYGRETVK